MNPEIGRESKFAKISNGDSSEAFSICANSKLSCKIDGYSLLDGSSSSKASMHYARNSLQSRFVDRHEISNNYIEFKPKPNRIISQYQRMLIVYNETQKKIYDIEMFSSQLCQKFSRLKSNNLVKNIRNDKNSYASSEHYMN